MFKWIRYDYLPPRTHSCTSNTHARTHIHARTYTYTYTHTHAHTQTHAHKRTCPCKHVPAAASANARAPNRRKCSHAMPSGDSLWTSYKIICNISALCVLFITIQYVWFMIYLLHYDLFIKKIINKYMLSDLLFDNLYCSVTLLCLLLFCFEFSSSFGCTFNIRMLLFSFRVKINMCLRVCHVIISNSVGCLLAKVCSTTE